VLTVRHGAVELAGLFANRAKEEIANGAVPVIQVIERFFALWTERTNDGDGF
jgi:hypothetical protein